MRMKAYLLLLCTFQSMQAMDPEWLSTFYVHDTYNDDTIQSFFPELEHDYVMPTSYTTPEYAFATPKPAAESIVLEELSYNGATLLTPEQPISVEPSGTDTIDLDLQIPPPTHRTTRKASEARRRSNRLSSQAYKARKKMHLHTLRTLIGDQVVCDTRELDELYAQENREIFLTEKQRLIAQLLTNHGGDTRVQDLCAMLEFDTVNRHASDSFSRVRSMITRIFKKRSKIPSDILMLYRTSAKNFKRASNALSAQKVRYAREQETRLLEAAAQKIANSVFSDHASIEDN